MTCRILLLTPTSIELKKLSLEFSFLDRTDVRTAVCGREAFSVATRSAELIDQHNPDNIVVAGTASSLGDSIAIGEAVVCSEVTIDPSNADAVIGPASLESMDWDFLDNSEPAFGSRLKLHAGTQDSLLLTVCEHSSTIADATNRHRNFPDAIAEDRETFAIAFAAASANIPLMSVRGIKNIAGSMDQSKWKLEAALSSAGKLTNRVVCDLL